MVFSGRRAPAFSLLAILVLLAVAAPSSAHESPTGCEQRVTIRATADKAIVRPGTVVNFTVVVDNRNGMASVACDVTNATVMWFRPAADGTETGATETLASAANFPSDTLTTVATVALTVNVNPGVSQLNTGFDVQGTLHDSDGDPVVDSSIHPQLRVTQPATTLRKTASPTGGRAPLAVTFTYTEHNDSSTDAPISNVALTDDQCAPVGRTGGDANGNDLLDVDETWTYTCVRTFASPGTFVNYVQATGTNVVDNLPAPLETAEATVVVRGPHTTLTVTPSTDSGTIPLDVTYTYKETNDGTDAIANVSITDDLCSPLTRTGGDVDADNVLDVGETWTFTCARTFTTAGTFKNDVKGTGIDVVDQQPAPLETATVTVTASAPVVATTTTVPTRVLDTVVARPVSVPTLPRTGPPLVAPLTLISLAGLGLGSVLAELARNRGRHSRRRFAWARARSDRDVE